VIGIKQIFCFLENLASWEYIYLPQLIFKTVQIRKSYLRKYLYLYPHVERQFS